MFYRFIKFTLGTFIKSNWSGRIEGLDFVPKEGPAIICANHQSYLDFLLLSSILKRRVYFLAAEVFFRSNFWKPLVKLTGQIMVDRETKDKNNVYREVDKLFKEKKILALFPEGTRSRSGKMGKGYNGAVKFAYKYRVPITPVGIIGTFNAWPPHQKFPKIRKIDVFFDKPYYITTDSFEEETRLLMKKIAKLSKQYYNY